jgi:hypothetical protein
VKSGAVVKNHPLNLIGHSRRKDGVVNIIADDYANDRAGNHFACSLGVIDLYDLGNDLLTGHIQWSILSV